MNSLKYILLGVLVFVPTTMASPSWVFGQDGRWTGCKVVMLKNLKTLKFKASSVYCLNESHSYSLTKERCELRNFQDFTKKAPFTQIC